MDANDRRPAEQRTPGKTPQAPPEVSAAIEALARLFAVAALYEPTHTRVVALAEPAVQALHAACGSRPALALDVGEGALHCDGKPLSERSPGMQRFRQDLDTLGVTRAELAREATVSDLLALGRLLRTRAQRRSGTAAYELVDLDGLPKTVRLTQHDFGTPTFDESEVPSAGAGTGPGGGHGRGGGGGGAGVAGTGGTGGGTVGGGVGRRGGSVGVGHAGSGVAGSGSDVVGSGLAGTGSGARGRGDAGGEGRAGVVLGNLTADEVRLLVGRAVTESAEAKVSAALDDDAEVRAPQGRTETLRAMAEAMRRIVDSHMKGGRTRGNVAAILEEAEKVLPRLARGAPVAPVLDALRLALDKHLRDAFRREASAAFDAKTPRAREAVEYELSLHELQQGLRQFTAGDEPFGDAAEMGPPETLSILLHLLSKAPSPQLLAAIGARLHTALSKPLGPAEQQVLSGWTRELCEREPGAVVDRTLPLVLSPIRSLGSVAVVDALLRPLRAGRGRALPALWPHVANELLGGVDESARHLEGEAAEVLAALAPEDVRDAMRRLATLPVVQGDRISKRFFSPPRPDLYGVYGLFLDSRELPRLGVHVLEAFRRAPPPSASLGALVVLREGDERVRAILARFLREQAVSGESVGLRRMAASTIVAELRALPRKRRGEEWVVRAITALRALPSREAEDLVGEVLGTRRLGLLQAWPVPARHAASAVQTAFRQDPGRAGAADVPTKVAS